MDVRPLTDVMATLRSPGGCPWDMEQTHSSIRKSLIEEVYELLEAIDNMDYENMKEELGDVLCRWYSMHAWRKKKARLPCRMLWTKL